MPDTLILTLNSGSTSVKLAAFRTSGTNGDIERLRHERLAGGDPAPHEALSRFIGHLPALPITAVAHRVVHGGTQFTGPARIDDEVEAAIDGLSRFAPLHNPPALNWIAAARGVLPSRTIHVAVFDTSFFTQLPSVAARYALSESLCAEAGVRRYGFHGIAHEMMWRRWCELQPHLPKGGRLITLQLGGGCSMAAIANGRPLDTSMGFSPLEGLVMATRAGDIDPAVVPYLSQRLGISAQRVVELLNRESGLRGVSGRTGDMSDLVADPSADSQFAVALYCYRARKYIGAYMAALGGCDGIVFGGGVGENVPQVRERILSDMEWAGITLDSQRNAAARARETRIDTAAGSIAVYVVPVDEESALARAALACL